MATLGADPPKNFVLRFELLSAATFGRGEGLPGLLDQEVEHDEFGLPYLRGRTLRGLLREELEGLLFALKQADQRKADRWKKAQVRLIGDSGMTAKETGILHIGNACLPRNLRHLVEASVVPIGKGKVTLATVLNSLTAIRRQTAMTPLGAPDDASLRSMRVILRSTPFESQFTFDSAPHPDDLALLSAAVLAWRRAGTGRNRGRGRLKAYLESEQWTRDQFEIFRQEVTAP